ncbi:MAG: uroporphyrinogen decarboxylase family protein [Sedimentisphaeraceae bacterium JB056]
MNSKKRVLTTFDRQEPDRVPINYFANPDIDLRLKKHFNINPNDDEKLREALNVDFRCIEPILAASNKHQDIPERNVKVDHWGIHRRWVEHDSGGYWDYCDFPLQNASIEEVEKWPMPSPDDYNYDNIIPLCEQYKDKAICIGNPGLACIINTAGFFRGMTQVFIDLATENPACMLLIDRFLDIQFETTLRTLEKSNGKIDIMWVGEDLGTQNSPLISMDMLRRLILPRQKRFFDLAKDYDLPVMMHNCGSSSWAFDEYIKLGLTAADTLQPEAANTSPEYLKKTFGDRLAFHGCISTAGPIAYGTVDDTIQYCRETLNIMMPGGGYCFAPTHSIQDNSPTENVLTMYETAMKYGRY